MATRLRFRTSPILLAVAISMVGCQSGAPGGPSTGGGPGSGAGSSGNPLTGAASNAPTACPDPDSEGDETLPPEDCGLFPGGGDGYDGTEGPPVPTTFTGRVTWTWEGGDSESFGGEHHDRLVVDVRLRVEPDWAGPFLGHAKYMDDGSTWAYEGTRIRTSTGPGCTVTITTEGQGQGVFEAGSNIPDEDDLTGPEDFSKGSISAVLEETEGFYDYPLGMDLRVSTGQFLFTETTAGCASTTTIEIEGEAGVLHCKRHRR